MAEVEFPKVYGSRGVVPPFVDMGAQYHQHVVEEPGSRAQYQHLVDTSSSVPAAYDVKMVHTKAVVPSKDYRVIQAK